MITVSIPTYRTDPKLLSRSVRSALDQAEDLRVIVVNDGGPPPRSIPRDDRVILFELEENMGRYFCDAIVTEAIADKPEEIWACLDSDDFWTPDHMDQILPFMKEGAVLSPYLRRREQKGRVTTQQPSTRLKGPIPDQYVHLGHWCSGAWTSDRVQKAGGIHPGFKVGFDTLFVAMINLTGPIGVAPSGGYSWCQALEGSLTTAPGTRFGSPLRIEQKRKQAALYHKAYDRIGEDPGEIIREDQSPLLRALVRAYARDLRRLME